MQETLFDSLEDISWDQKGNLPLKANLGPGMKNVDINNVSALSKPKQTKIFIARLNEEAQRKGSFIFDIQELTKIARDMRLSIGDFSTYMEELNI